jgi:cytosine/adenosine deaminase-related metal-dependent hydrolase
MRPLNVLIALGASLAALLAAAGEATVTPAPARDRGDGPYAQLILRNAVVVDGTGAPANGPMDIVVEGDRIVRIVSVADPVFASSSERPKLAADGREIDVAGGYVLPGFVDMHGHLGGVEQGTPAEYVLKLWLAHGITTVRDPGSGNGIAFVVDHARKSERDEVVAPRLVPYLFFGADAKAPITTGEQARAWVRDAAKRGAKGVKFFSAPPEVLKAALEECRKQGLGSTMHHAQLSVARADVLDTARWGLQGMEHWYGLPEALFTDRTVQDYPLSYNYSDESHRFGEAGRLWAQAAAPGSERWVAVRDELIRLGFGLDPTLTIYEASRDLMAQRTAEWHAEYTLPSLWDFFAPNRNAHGSYWFDWTTADEVAWKRNYQLWMRFVDDYKDHGGRVTAGSDSGYIYKLYGFGYVRELELLQEAGFHPLEVVRAATLHGAEALGMADRIGSVEVGKLADLVVVPENPLANLKVLYGTGHVRVTADNRVVRTGGVRYTIKGGVVYDAAQLRDDVKRMVREAKQKAGRPTLLQPGVTATADHGASP